MFVGLVFSSFEVANSLKENCKISTFPIPSGTIIESSNHQHWHRWHRYHHICLSLVVYYRYIYR